MSDYSPTIEKAHPNAKRLMNEEFYWSPIEETAPFGSDVENPRKLTPFRQKKLTPARHFKLTP